MTPADFRAIRAALGMTQGGLASALGIGRRTVQQYEADDRAIPETIARIMRLAQTDPSIVTRIEAA